MKMDRQIPQRTLYPPLEPWESGHLRVSGLHEIYYEQCGNPDGQPALYLGNPTVHNLGAMLGDRATPEGREPIIPISLSPPPLPGQPLG